MDNTHSEEEYSNESFSIEDSNEESIDDFSIPLILKFSETNRITQTEKDALCPRSSREERIDNFVNEHRQYHVVDQKVAAMFEERVGQGV